MRRTTKKLSGVAKDRFLKRFFAEEEGLASDVADRLAQRGARTFSSVRVRRLALAAAWRRPAATPAGRAAAPPAAVVAPASPSPAGHPGPTANTAGAEPAAFDPFVFGLVPVFQREGRDGLLAQLETIAEVADLRRMAREQQIVLPQALRTGAPTAEEVRTAIADAVAKRVADRRAAAGG